MKRTFSSILLSLTLISGSVSAFEGDYELGVFQLNRGEFKAAIAEFEPLLKQQYAPAQYQMGLVYLNGWGVIKNKEKALEFIKQSAEQSYPEALFNLSTIYTDGELVEQDLKMAFTLMKKAADKSLPSAQFNLGVMYANGQGAPKDARRAAHWYELAAKQNFPLAQFNLALMYYEGIGVKQSHEKSYLWNIIAAKSGYKQAITSRDMDERNLSIKQIEEVRTQAEKLYSQILEQVDLRTKELSQKSFL